MMTPKDFKWHFDNGKFPRKPQGEKIVSMSPFSAGIICLLMCYSPDKAMKIKLIRNLAAGLLV